MQVFILSLDSGNLRSIENALNKLEIKYNFIKSNLDFEIASHVIFPGVGSFGSVIQKLNSSGFKQSLISFIKNGGFYLGICVGMQALFNSSEESIEIDGLGIINASCTRFLRGKSIPHIGWNSAQCVDSSDTLFDQKFYFVHSYCVIFNDSDEIKDWAYSLTRYKDQVFVSSIRKGNVFATQFHPEKSSQQGLNLIASFLNSKTTFQESPKSFNLPKCALSYRLIACLDVCKDESGNLITTKGDSYNTIENKVTRNMGDPISMAIDYYTQNIDELVFLNITSYKSNPTIDHRMLDLLLKTSENVFVPLTIGGGIRDISNGDKTITSLEIATLYFQHGADKISIGSDAIPAAQTYFKSGKSGTSSIELISNVYGSQAVVVSIDPQRVYVSSPIPNHTCIKTTNLGPNNEEYCWFQCTMNGGKKPVDLDVCELAKAVVELGAGEILLNCIDNDGKNAGFDLELIKLVVGVVDVPVIASSGAGKVEHFEDAFNYGASAGLAAGIFHRKEVSVGQVKEFLSSKNINVR